MDSHGYTDYDEIDMVDHESFAIRRGNPQTSNIHMTQQMTTKVAPAYDGRSSFFAFEDAIDDWATSQNWSQRREAQHQGTDWKEMHLNTKDSLIESC